MCTVHLGTRVLSLDFFVIIIVSTEFMVLLDGKVESEKMSIFFFLQLSSEVRWRKKKS